MLMLMDLMLSTMFDLEQDQLVISNLPKQNTNVNTTAKVLNVLKLYYIYLFITK
jgi:hypothetical protein